MAKDLDKSGEEPSSTRVSGWGRVFRGNRMLWLTAVIAALSLVAGLGLGRFLINPATAGETPEPGLITVPVSLGELSNDVLIRADVGYADAVEVTFDTASISGAAIVTGQVPEEDSELTALSLAVEISGRPVIVLPGVLPAYRTIRFGVSGPDVLQLKQALASVGIDPGNAESDQYDQATANAVAKLYAEVGYPSPPAEPGADDAYRSAQEGVRGAEESLASARKMLQEAERGPDAISVRRADNAIAELLRQITDAQISNPDQVPGLQDQLALAQLERGQLFVARDTSAELNAISSAEQQLSLAREGLEKARQAVQPYLPASEVLYLSELPRRVDRVNIQRGSVLSGVAMTVSGASVRLSGGVAEAEAKLLKVGDEAFFDLPEGTAHRAVITEINAPESGNSRWQVLLEPDPLDGEQVRRLQGTNVRLQIAVGATDGAVLSVPLAALTAGAGGESRVEVAEGDPRDPKVATRLVTVETGLAAQGAVEVRPTQAGTLSEGDLVVVGR